MMNLSQRLESLQQERRKALSLFITAGYPTMESTVPLAIALARAGADVIELGIPFSDPIADGPTIQMSSEAALRNGMTLEKTFSMAQAIRRETDVPLVLMGYANPVYAFGLVKFLGRCKDTGIDGTIIADLPLEESTEYRQLAQTKDLATIFLASPTTPRERLILLDHISTGFLYYISITGVTGERQSLPTGAESFLQEARAAVKRNPLLVGFGITTPADAKRIAAFSDGVIVGSALIKILHNAEADHRVEHAVQFVQSLRNALDS